MLRTTIGKALTIQRSLGNRQQMAVTLKNTGAFYRDLGEPANALNYLNEALEVSRAIGDQNVVAGVLAEIARLERDRVNLIVARSRIEEALAAVESLRINVKSHELRTSFFASVRQYHERDTDIHSQFRAARTQRNRTNSATFLRSSTARNNAVANESVRQRSNRLARAEAEYPKVSAELGRMLLGALWLHSFRTSGC